MSLSRNGNTALDNDTSISRTPLSLHSPALPPHISVPTSTHQKVRREFAAQKHRPKEELRFYTDAAMALPAAARSAHAVEKVTKKGAVRFFKHNTTDSIMSELEAAVWSIYHINAPHHVPAKANAHYNRDNEYIGISTLELPNFRSTMDEPLEEKDLLKRSTVKALAIILTLSYILEEDDLHRGNMSRDGLRIDFDMSLWPVLGNFKEGTMIDWMYRPRDQERFCMTANDIDNFPDIKDAKPFYWPTIPQPIITEGARNVLSNFIPISRNAFPTKENILFKKLKDNPDFQYEKFKTLLKFLLISTDQYSTLITQHIRTDLSYHDTQKQNGKISDLLIEHLDTRKWKLRELLVAMPSFQEFLWAHGVRAKQEILQEFTEYNQGMRTRESMKRAKNPQRDTAKLYDNLIHLEDIKKTYNSIFREAKQIACPPLVTRKLR